MYLAHVGLYEFHSVRFGPRHEEAPSAAARVRHQTPEPRRADRRSVRRSAATHLRLLHIRSATGDPRIERRSSSPRRSRVRRWRAATTSGRGGSNRTLRSGTSEQANTTWSACNLRNEVVTVTDPLSCRTANNSSPVEIRSATAAAICRTNVSMPSTTRCARTSSPFADAALMCTLLGNEQQRDLVGLLGELALAVATMKQLGDRTETGLLGYVREGDCIKFATPTCTAVGSLGHRCTSPRCRRSHRTPPTVDTPPARCQPGSAGAHPGAATVGSSSTAVPRPPASWNNDPAEPRMRWWCVSIHSAPLSTYWPPRNGSRTVRTRPPSLVPASITVTS